MRSIVALGRPLASIGVLLCIAPMAAGCTAAATAALNIAGTIAVKAFDLDSAIIDNIKARRDAAADPNMSGGRGEAFGSPGVLLEGPFK
jgi:hypothetical protein